MRERINRAQGSWQITTQPGHGTAIEAIVPIPAARPGFAVMRPDQSQAA
jgi:hypothetical protein